MAIEPYTTPTTTQTKPNVVDQRPKKIVCMGDSVTGATTRPNYVGHLQLMLGGSYNLVNKGVPGEITSQMVTRFTADVINQQPAEVIILGGINDLNQGGGGLASAVIIANLGTMYAAATAAGIIVRPILIAPYGNGTLWTSGRETKRNEVNDWIRQQPYVYTDIETTMADWTLLTQPQLKAIYDYGDGGGVHPSLAGAIEYARLVFLAAYHGGPVGQKREGLI